MKKWLSIILTLGMSLSLCACGGGGDEGGELPAPEDGGTTTAPSWQTLTLDDADSTTFTMEYPEEFTFNPDNMSHSFLHQDNTKCGALEGPDYSIGIAFCSINTDAYDDVPDYASQFDLNPLFVEQEIAGTTSYIRQTADIYMSVIIPTSATEMVILDVQMNEGGETADYQALLDGDVIPAMLASIEISAEAVETDPVTSELGYVTVTPADGWYVTEPRTTRSVTLTNDDFGTCWIDIVDDQLQNMTDRKDIAQLTLKDAVYEEITIGAVTYQMLQNEDGTLTELLAETSTGKAFQIEVRNVTLDDAMTVLESIVVH